LGGLGIIDLQHFGYALRMRWLWLKRTEDARPWHELPDEKDPIVEAMFQASIYVELGDGRKALFWTDRWLQGKSLVDVAPSLCRVIGPRIKKTRTVAQALQANRWTKDISGALTVQVILDYLLVWDLMRGVNLVDDRPDSAGNGQQTRFFLAPPPTDLSSLDNILLKELGCFVRYEPRPNANFSFG